MKIVEIVDVISKGDVTQSTEWRQACHEVILAITATDWPHGKGKFTLNPRSPKHANGVEPMKTPCMNYLQSLGWRLEQLPTELAGVPIGNLDAMFESEANPIGFEWETGNISSSRRAINKIFHAMLKGGLAGGILVLPSQKMRRYLTDRVGNITELREYFPVWQAIGFQRGAFQIVVVEYDELDESAPLIPVHNAISRHDSDVRRRNTVSPPSKVCQSLRTCRLRR